MVAMLAHAYLAVNGYHAARDLMRESLSIVLGKESGSQKVRIASGVLACNRCLGHHKHSVILTGAIRDQLLVDTPFFRNVGSHGLRRPSVMLVMLA